MLLTVSCALGPQNPVMHKPVPVSQVCAITKFVIVMALVIHLHYSLLGSLPVQISSCFVTFVPQQSAHSSGAKAISHAFMSM